MPGKDAGKGGGGDHAFQEKIEPKKQGMIEFAKRIADYLDAARKTNKLDNLLIVAAPEFLGELRNQLSAETSKIIAYELDKNFAHHDEDDIRQHLTKYFTSKT